MANKQEVIIRIGCIIFFFKVFFSLPFIVSGSFLFSHTAGWFIISPGDTNVPLCPMSFMKLKKRCNDQDYILLCFA